MDTKRLIFLDESGIDTFMPPFRDRAPKGRRVEGSAPKSWQTTIIAAIGLDGLKGSLAFHGAMGEPAFQTYVENVLAPHLHPGDVVVMDNLRVHDSQAARAAVERVGAKEISLPPLSPDENPLEEMWPKVTAATRTPDLYLAVADALEQVTLSDIAGRYRHLGLYAMPG